MSPTPADVRRFWFGQPDPTRPATVDSSMWWKGGDALDAQIGAQFSGLMARALAGELSAWRSTSEDTLALILLLDQFPRNVHRGTAQAFAGDPLARELARALDGGPEAWDLDARCFALMPFEHSEDLADQEHSVKRFGELAAGGDSKAAYYLEFAEKHRDIVARFGRFPHRNRVLGRVSSPAERSFLEDGGPSFGQG